MIGRYESGSFGWTSLGSVKSERRNLDSGPEHGPKLMELIPVVELGVDEAYRILTERFGIVDLPPLDAIENEDWGRDLLLSRLGEFSEAELASVGLVFSVD